MSEQHIPKHIAIICDGNRRWAKEHMLEAFKGHEHAVRKTFQPLIDRAIERGVEYLTFWIFSTENWSRDKVEVEGLMRLFRQFFDEQIDKWDEKGVRFKMIGRRSDFASDIQERIERGVEKTKNNTNITVTLAMSYGGRDELLRAFSALQEDIAAGNETPADINKETIAKYLDTNYQPDPDFIIRTSGEQRLSGFMLWQSEYAELYFPQFHFPEFTPEKLDECLEEYASRQRRFGK